MTVWPRKCRQPSTWRLLEILGFAVISAEFVLIQVQGPKMVKSPRRASSRLAMLTLEVPDAVGEGPSNLDSEAALEVHYGAA